MNEMPKKIAPLSSIDAIYSKNKTGLLEGCYVGQMFGGFVMNRIFQSF